MDLSSLSQIPFSCLMSFAQGFSSVYSCAKICLPQILCHCGGRHLIHFNLKDSSFHLSSTESSPSAETKVIGSVCLDQLPNAQHQPISMSSASVSGTGQHVPLILGQSLFSLKVHPPSSPQKVVLPCSHTFHSALHKWCFRESQDKRFLQGLVSSREKHAGFEKFSRSRK